MVREVAHARKRNPLSDVNEILQDVGMPDVITYANFGEDRLRSLGVAGGQNVPFSVDFDRRPYNNLARYRTTVRKKTLFTSAGRGFYARLT